MGVGVVGRDIFQDYLLRSLDLADGRIADRLKGADVYIDFISLTGQVHNPSHQGLEALAFDFTFVVDVQINLLGFLRDAFFQVQNVAILLYDFKCFGVVLIFIGLEVVGHVVPSLISAIVYFNKIYLRVHVVIDCIAYSTRVRPVIWGIVENTVFRSQVDKSLLLDMSTMQAFDLPTFVI